MFTSTLAVDERERGTPDEWIVRDPALIRLTGRHPFNAEPSTQELIKHGFLTPISIHYVRNHGTVPNLQWETHRVEISGMVEHPMTLAMDEIAALPSIKLPVTLACSGNRRKEQNMIARSMGFHWGPGAVSTSIWRGVRLAEVLHKCADQLPIGYYGTCIPIQRAIDEYFDVLLAYEMNGERLTPDHGYPLRLIVSGCIGGRAVKWLSRIFVSDKESVITHPGHGELVPLDINTANTVRGYAYSGASYNIKRVQVSLDGGKTWRLVKLDDGQEEEERKKVGMEQGRYRSWCWRLWTLEIQISDLVKSSVELVCRGWDTNNNTQPQTTEWNLMGMMHNAWYIHPAVIDEELADTGAGGFQNKGWLKPPLHDLLEVTTLGDKVLVEPNPYRFTRATVAKHASHGDAWVIVHNKVYDCSAFLDEHPGGPANATKVFKQIHSIDNHEIFGNYLLGEVDDRHSHSSDSNSSMGSDLGDGDNNDNNINNNNSKHFLSPQWQPIRLIKKNSISYDSRIFRYALSSPKIKFGLPTGKHVLLRAKSKHDGKMYVRAYTPISDEDSLPGFAEFLIKVYTPAKGHPKGGHMSQVLDSLEIGETIEVRGPLGSFLYLGHGCWTFGTHSGRACRIVTLAGGTGITPIYQLIRAIVMDPTDQTEVRFIYANKTEEEILLREELLYMKKDSTGRVKIRHETLNHAIDTTSVMCGPPPMIEKACLPNIIRIYGNEMMRMHRSLHRFRKDKNHMGLLPLTMYRSIRGAYYA
ncbi:hypothetical protein BGZ96_003094 [Linnemannia gamsii]|uniref:Nitrate reductase [NADPH] n=1 Tax=Linnemannia gamsii TaxID=64522 RepID=A0ABQ7JK36_9FUNG|nr:hypothetical protein BGZ96_003094 [Linnemannia gamsii]